jgi:homocysteine S-methyltransferase
MENPKKLITILDGGMSRELIRLNAPFRQPEWSAMALLEAPHFVSQVHRDFLAAGADIITTNSYAIVPYHIGEERFWKDGERLAALAGRLAREVADEAAAATGCQIRVAGCLPPIFGSYEPAKFDGSAVGKYFEILVRALDPYVDLWLAETLSLVSEAQAAYDATSRTKKPFWVAFTPDDRSTASTTTPFLRSGETLEEAARWAFSTGAQALLFNCARPEYMAGAIEVATSISSTYAGSNRPLLGVYANAFEPRSNEYAANENVCPTDDKLNTKVYSDFASEWIAKGVDIVGGCCGIGHEHIQKLAQEFKSGPVAHED